jgi:hypothetical protein
MNTDELRLAEWLAKKNDTPTFSLNPVEKPDMSPFLVHLTGKNSLMNILQGANSGNVRANWGFLKSGVPNYSSASNYHAPVVCFTESPIFALDFFRLRSFKRFMQDQQYGIGFSKSKLILNRGVRPVLYLDRKTNSNLLKIIQLAENSDLSLTGDQAINKELSDTVRDLKPLLFPMFETNPAQGFMWEREWRYPSPKGLNFHYSEIEIICCPVEERQQIADQLGEFSKNIEIVENWREYDEVKSYLESRGVDILGGLTLGNIEDLNKLYKLRDNVGQIMHGLCLFKTTFKLTSTTFNDSYVEDKLKNLLDYHWRVEQQIELISGYEQERADEMHRQYLQELRPDY